MSEQGPLSLDNIPETPVLDESGNQTRGQSQPGAEELFGAPGHDFFGRPITAGPTAEERIQAEREQEKQMHMVVFAAVLKSRRELFTTVTERDPQASVHGAIHRFARGLTERVVQHDPDWRIADELIFRLWGREFLEQAMPNLPQVHVSYDRAAVSDLRELSMPNDEQLRDFTTEIPTPTGPIPLRDILEIAGKSMQAVAVDPQIPFDKKKSSHIRAQHLIDQLHAKYPSLVNGHTLRRITVLHGSRFPRPEEQALYGFVPFAEHVVVGLAYDKGEIVIDPSIGLVDGDPESFVAEVTDLRDWNSSLWQFRYGTNGFTVPSTHRLKESEMGQAEQESPPPHRKLLPLTVVTSEGHS